MYHYLSLSGESSEEAFGGEKNKLLRPRFYDLSSRVATRAPDNLPLVEHLGMRTNVHVELVEKLKTRAAARVALRRGSSTTQRSATAFFKESKHFVDVSKDSTPEQFKRLYTNLKLGSTHMAYLNT